MANDSQQEELKETNFLRLTNLIQTKDYADVTNKLNIHIFKKKSNFEFNIVVNNNAQLLQNLIFLLVQANMAISYT